MPFPLFTELSPSGSDNPTGLWYLTKEGLMSHDYTWIFEVQEGDPHTEFELDFEPSDFPTIAASSFAAVAQFLPLCHGLCDVFRRRQDGKFEQIRPIYFAVRGQPNIFTSMCGAIPLPNSADQPSSADVERAFENAGNYWGIIYASHSRDEAEFHAGPNIFDPEFQAKPNLFDPPEILAELYLTLVDYE
ncbi:hypothetical protein DFH09DRAFT_1110029 [Mycena vulgaris]|nr:hypothetical protein DFH09DRAFT_1110029 [Mycena vulgaris]